jgi:diguanylate cyclase (GGDEF)-like protein
MMFSERRQPQREPAAGWDQRPTADDAAGHLKGEQRRARTSLRSIVKGIADRLTPRPGDDVRWVGDSMLRTTGELAVYVFRGEATIARDLVVTHRGPGRDRLLGGPATGAARSDWAHSVHPEDRAVHRAAESYVQLAKGLPISASFRIVGVDGNTRWVNEHLTPSWENGRLRVDGIVVDVTSQRTARIDAELATRRLEAVMRSARTFVWVCEVDAAGTMHSIYSIAGIEGMFGNTLAETADPQERWRSAVHPDDLERFDAAVAAAANGVSFDMEYRMVGEDGETRIVRDQAVATLLGEGRCRLDGLVQDVTQEHDARRALEDAKLAAESHAERLAAAHAELERIGRLDSLTGLVNRRHATKLMDEALARRDPVGIAMLDIDRFKGVNDTYGHAGGDAVLIEIARRLAATRAEDLVARWGGEEFCVLLTGIEDDEALLAAAERLREAIEAEPVRLDDGTYIDVTTSIGAVRPGCPNQRLERLVMAADDALYEAKRGGRNQVRLITDLPAETVTERAS